jgi:hypothetical protein
MRGSIAVSAGRFPFCDGRSLQIRRPGAARRVAPVATYPVEGFDEAAGRAGSTAWSNPDTTTTVAQPIALNHR